LYQKPEAKCHVFSRSSIIVSERNEREEGRKRREGGKRDREREGEKKYYFKIPKYIFTCRTEQ
jgi:hypothetical protein